jgi:hypothetical protein
MREADNLSTTSENPESFHGLMWGQHYWLLLIPRDQATRHLALHETNILVLNPSITEVLSSAGTTLAETLKRLKAIVQKCRCCHTGMAMQPHTHNSKCGHMVT